MPETQTPNNDPLVQPALPFRRRRLLGMLTISLAFIVVLTVVVGISISLNHQQTRLPGIYLCSDCPGTPTPLSISMVSADDGWAVGVAEGAALSRSQGVMAHYQHGQWTPLTLPASTPELFSVFMLSATDGWSVGDGGIIMHYTGGRWVSVASPTKDSLTSVFMLSATDGWAVGMAGTILQYRGTTWQLVFSDQAFLGLWSIVMVSPSEGWAVGLHLIAHYWYGVWTRWDPSRPPASINLFSVTMLSASEGWAVGLDTHGETPVIMHYQQRSWQPETTDLNVEGRLSAVAMVSPEEGWALGTEYDLRGNGPGSLIVHYTRKDGWTRVPTPLHSPFNALSMLSSTDGWAVGSNNTFVHYADGVWC